MTRIARGSNSTAKVIGAFATVEDFLAALTGNQGQVADVLLAPVYRPIRPGNGVISIQAGVMLNGQRPGYQRIFSCIALAAEAVLVAERGRLTFPPHGDGDDALVRQRIRDLQEELLAALCTYPADGCSCPTCATAGITVGSHHTTLGSQRPARTAHRLSGRALDGDFGRAGGPPMNHYHDIAGHRKTVSDAPLFCAFTSAFEAWAHALQAASLGVRPQPCFDYQQNQGESEQ